MTGSKKHELKSKHKFEKKQSFYTKVRDAVTSLNAKKAISKKKKKGSRQKKLKAYDLSALSDFLPEAAAPQQQPEQKLNCKSKQMLVQQEAAQLQAVLNNPSFRLDPFSAIHQHLMATQPPSAVDENATRKHGRKSKKDKKKGRKIRSSDSGAMDFDTNMN